MPFEYSLGDVPEGHCEDSRAFQRRERRPNYSSPEGTAELTNTCENLQPSPWDLPRLLSNNPR